MIWQFSTEEKCKIFLVFYKFLAIHWHSQAFRIISRQIPKLSRWAKCKIYQKFSPNPFLSSTHRIIMNLANVFLRTFLTPETSWFWVNIRTLSSLISLSSWRREQQSWWRRWSGWKSVKTLWWAKANWIQSVFSACNTTLLCTCSLIVCNRLQ